MAALIPEAAEIASVDGAMRTIAIEDELRVCAHGSVNYGRGWISIWGRPARLAQWAERNLGDAKSLRAEELDAWRIQALRPAIDREITENSNPLELGLSDAIAPNKGCYPGQEVIEKIISLGAPAKRLGRIEFTDAGGLGAEMKVPAPLFNLAEPPQEVGQLTSVTSPGEKTQGLALLKKIHARNDLPVQVGTNSALTDTTPLRGIVAAISS